MGIKFWILMLALIGVGIWVMSKQADAAMDACMRSHSEATCFYSVR